MKRLVIDVQKYITNLMPKYDRLLHFFVGFFLFELSVNFFSNIISLAILFVVGVIKELSDKYIKDSYFDITDLLFTILSGVIITATHLTA